jgi:regulator of protease activity HflC (stomatin/prohibitin superfamily)
MTQNSLMQNTPTQNTLNQTVEKPASVANGGFILILALLALGLGIASLVAGPKVIGGILIVLFIFTVAGFYTLQANEAAAITLFGDYMGTDRTPGLRWVIPWYGRTKISLRARNVTGEKLKVNDKRGNPIEIAAVVVWRVTDTAAALFDVDHYEDFVNIQIETAVREIASHFAYDHGEHEEPTLRAGADLVSARLRELLQDRLHIAGVMVDEAKLSHLAYAPEIASAMLRRQQAEAVLAARQKIVQGAVEMVDQALRHLAERNVVELDTERKAAMVSNLLVVLCSDSEAQPVVNTGSLYN